MKKLFISKKKAARLFKKLVFAEMEVKLTFKKVLFFRYYVLEY